MLLIWLLRVDGDTKNVRAMISVALRWGNDDEVCEGEVLCGLKFRLCEVDQDISVPSC